MKRRAPEPSNWRMSLTSRVMAALRHIPFPHNIFDWIPGALIKTFSPPRGNKFAAAGVKSEVFWTSLNTIETR